ncbi:prenyltransferase [Saccharothrix sp.]|uniref:prenyltransferase n=1 Tax=Saccharothrix sp. TaxID=1873460 RepID=UPI0028114972|nr:prenyltransferase [Saccharothrix sp.]
MGGRLAAFIRLSRLRFLVESQLTVTLGVAVSVYSGHAFALGTWLLIQSTVVLTHLMTHYCNEYFDLAADSAHTAPNRWTGGSQVLVKGALRPEVSLAAAFVLLFVVLLLTVVMPSPVQRLISLAAIALAWFYTAPPVRLNYRAVGEVTTAASLTLFCPFLMVYSLTGGFPAELVAVCVPLLLVMTARMMVMNFVDRDSDLVVGKHTLPNTLGARKAALLFAGLQVAAYATVLVTTVIGVLPLAVGVGLLLTVPGAVVLSRRLLREPPSPDAPEQATSTAHLATAHAAATGVVAVVGFTVATAIDDGVTASVVACAVLFALYVTPAVGVQVLDAFKRGRAGAVGAA